MPENDLPESEMSLSETLGRLAGTVGRRRWWILLSTVTVTLVTAMVAYQLPNRYTSEATLLVVQQQVPLRYVTPTTTTDVADALQAMTQEVLSRTRLLELIGQFDLFAKERQGLAPEELITLIRKYIQIQPIDPTVGHKEFNAFKISFTGDRAILAQRVTTRLTSLFIEANLKTREDQASNTTSFLQEHLNAAKEKLTQQEERLRDFKMQHLGELPEQQQGNLAILSGAQQQLQNIAASSDRAQQQRVYLNSLLNGYRRLVSKGAPTPGRSEPGVPRPLQNAQEELAKLQTERARLLSTYSPAYPDVVRIDKEIATVAARVESMKAVQPSPAGSQQPRQSPESEGTEEDSSIAQLQSQLEANRMESENLSKEEKRLKEVILEYQMRLNQTPVREQQLAQILRDYELSKQDYSDLLGKEQQSQLAMSLEKHQGGQQFRLVDSPSLPALPSSPKRLKISLGGFGGGLLFGLALAFLADFRNPSFRTEKEVKQRFSPPIVLTLPFICTPAQQLWRNWRVGLEWFGGTVLATAVLLAEFYVYRHP